MIQKTLKEQDLERGQLGETEFTAHLHFRVAKLFSKRAREERALAAERRLLALQGRPKGQKFINVELSNKPLSFDLDVQPISQSVPDHTGSQANSDDEVEIIEETDADRRQALLDSEQDGDERQKLNSNDFWKLFRDEFTLEDMGTGRAGSSKDQEIIEIFSSDEEDGQACDIPVPSGSTFTTENIISSSSSGNGKMKAAPSRNKQPLGFGMMVKHEINFRRKEALGMVPDGGGGRTLGTKPSAAEPSDREGT